MNMVNNLEKRLRLKRREDFAKVYRRKQSTANQQFVVYKRGNSQNEQFRVGISVSKKIGNAVVRNRIRRVIKEIIRRHQSKIRPGFDIVIIARNRVVTMDFTEIEKSLLHVLKRASLLTNS